MTLRIIAEHCYEALFVECLHSEFRYAGVVAPDTTRIDEITNNRSYWLQKEEAPGPTFVDCGRAEIELGGLSFSAFDSVMTYLYTGVLNINDDNVFSVIETCQFLQIEDKKLNESFGKFLTT